MAQDPHPLSLPLAPHGGSGNTSQRGILSVFSQVQGVTTDQSSVTPQGLSRERGLASAHPFRTSGSPGFSASGLLHSGLDHSLSRAVLCTAGCLAASLASTHQEQWPLSGHPRPEPHGPPWGCWARQLASPKAPSPGAIVPFRTQPQSNIVSLLPFSIGHAGQL